MSRQIGDERRSVARASSTRSFFRGTWTDPIPHLPHAASCCHSATPTSTAFDIRRRRVFTFLQFCLPSCRCPANLYPAGTKSEVASAVAWPHDPHPTRKPHPTHVSSHDHDGCLALDDARCESACAGNHTRFDESNAKKKHQICHSSPFLSTSSFLTFAAPTLFIPLLLKAYILVVKNTKDFVRVHLPGPAACIYPIDDQDLLHRESFEYTSPLKNIQYSSVNTRLRSAGGI